MALPVNGVMEVNKTGIAADNNGGMFDSSLSGSGKDYTFGTYAVVYVLTDLVLVSATLATSASRPFTNDDVGNTINITSGTGFTPGWYSIRAVNNLNQQATLDRTAGTAGSVGGQGRLGGPLATPGQAMSLFVVGNGIWIGPGTYNLSVTPNVSGGRMSFSFSGGGSASWSLIRGHDGNRGIPTSPPILSNNNVATSVPIISIATTTSIRVMDLILDGTTQTSGLTLSRIGLVQRVQAKNCINGFTFDSSSSYKSLVDCTAINCTIGYSCAVSPTVAIVGSAAINCTTGFSANVAFECIAIGGTTGFQSLDGNITYRNIISYGCSGNGIEVTPDSGMIQNAISYGHGGFAYYCASATRSIDLINCAGPAGGTVGFDTRRMMVENYITLSADPFVDGPNKDFRINRTAGGGTQMRSLTATNMNLPLTITHPWFSHITSSESISVF